MGAFLDKPKVEKQNEKGKGNELEYSVSSMQGWRVDMEDSHTAKVELPGLPNWSFFAVFDGHAGSKIAEYSSTHLLEVIMDHDTIRKLVADGGQGENEKLIEEAIKQSFLDLDKKMRNISDAKNGVDRSGSTSVCVLISPTRYYFINCGDSRALLCRNGKLQFATADHKPNNPLERDRIQKAGGSVMIQRVNGSLAVSRALGDYEYKNVEDKGPTEQLVSPEPDITAIERSTKEDEFLLLACDGIFDVSSNEDLVSYISSRLAITDDLTKICNDVVDMSLNKGSRDNMTLVLLAFSAIPKPSDQAKVEEEKLEEQLKIMLKKLCAENKVVKAEGMDFSYAFQNLVSQEDKIPGLPPGGGIYAKRGFLEKSYREIYPDDENNQNDSEVKTKVEQTNSVPMESESGM